MKVAIYVRVSTDKQDETLQLPRCRDYAERKGWEVYGEYHDKASGKNGNRPGWMALESDAHLGDFDAVLVTKLDRMMRSLSSMLEIFETFSSLGISIITIEQGVLDLKAGPTARLQIHLLAMLAEWEREIISDRTKEGLEARRAKGVHIGRKKTEGIPIHAIALMRLDGSSWSEIARSLGISRSMLQRRRKDIEIEMEGIGIPEERKCWPIEESK